MSEIKELLSNEKAQKILFSKGLQNVEENLDAGNNCDEKIIANTDRNFTPIEKEVNKFTFQSRNASSQAASIYSSFNSHRSSDSKDFSIANSKEETHQFLPRSISTKQGQFSKHISKLGESLVEDTNRSCCESEKEVVQRIPIYPRRNLLQNGNKFQKNSRNSMTQFGCEEYSPQRNNEQQSQQQQMMQQQQIAQQQSQQFKIDSQNCYAISPHQNQNKMNQQNSCEQFQQFPSQYPLLYYPQQGLNRIKPIDQMQEARENYVEKEEGSKALVSIRDLHFHLRDSFKQNQICGSTIEAEKGEIKDEAQYDSILQNGNQLNGRQLAILRELLKEEGALLKTLQRTIQYEILFEDSNCKSMPENRQEFDQKNICFVPEQYDINYYQDNDYESAQYSVAQEQEEQNLSERKSRNSVIMYSQGTDGSVLVELKERDGCGTFHLSDTESLFQQQSQIERGLNERTQLKNYCEKQQQQQLLLEEDDKEEENIRKMGQLLMENNKQISRTQCTFQRKESATDMRSDCQILQNQLFNNHNTIPFQEFASMKVIRGIQKSTQKKDLSKSPLPFSKSKAEDHSEIDKIERELNYQESNQKISDNKLTSQNEYPPLVADSLQNQQTKDQSPSKMNEMLSTNTRSDNRCMEDIVEQIKYLKQRSVSMDVSISSDIQLLEEKLSQIFLKIRQDKFGKCKQVKQSDLSIGSSCQYFSNQTKRKGISDYTTSAANFSNSSSSKPIQLTSHQQFIENYQQSETIDPHFNNQDEIYNHDSDRQFTEPKYDSRNLEQQSCSQDLQQPFSHSKESYQEWMEEQYEKTYTESQFAALRSNEEIQCNFLNKDDICTIMPRSNDEQQHKLKELEIEEQNQLSSQQSNQQFSPKSAKKNLFEKLSLQSASRYVVSQYSEIQSPHLENRQEQNCSWDEKIVDLTSNNEDIFDQKEEQEMDSSEQIFRRQTTSDFEVSDRTQSVIICTTVNSSKIQQKDLQCNELHYSHNKENSVPQHKVCLVDLIQKSSMLKNKMKTINSLTTAKKSINQFDNRSNANSSGIYEQESTTQIKMSNHYNPENKNNINSNKINCEQMKSSLYSQLNRIKTKLSSDSSSQIPDSSWIAPSSFEVSDCSNSKLSDHSVISDVTINNQIKKPQPLKDKKMNQQNLKKCLEDKKTCSNIKQQKEGKNQNDEKKKFLRCKDFTFQTEVSTYQNNYTIEDQKASRLLQRKQTHEKVSSLYSQHEKNTLNKKKKLTVNSNSNIFLNLNLFEWTFPEKLRARESSIKPNQQKQKHKISSFESTTQ